MFQKKSQCLLPFPRFLGLRNKTLYPWHLVKSAGCQAVCSTELFLVPDQCLYSKTLFASTLVLAPSRSVPAISSNIYRARQCWSNNSPAGTKNVLLHHGLPSVISFNRAAWGQAWILLYKGYIFFINRAAWG